MRIIAKVIIAAVSAVVVTAVCGCGSSARGKDIDDASITTESLLEEIAETTDIGVVLVWERALERSMGLVEEGRIEEARTMLRSVGDSALRRYPYLAPTIEMVDVDAQIARYASASK